MHERLRIERKRFKQMEKRHHRSKTLDNLISKREWVEEGMIGLVNMLKDSWKYFDSLVCLACYQPITCHQYSWALGYALSTMWILCMNARNGCIERLTMKDYHNIQSKNFHLASDFKTSSKYSYQIVSTTDIVGIFIKYIRIHVISSDIDSDDAVVFPSFKGTPLCPGEGSKKVSNIFKRYGYQLTVTKLRAIISTHLEDKFHNNEITLEEYQLCVESGQTHSLTTHKKYYLKKRKYDHGNIIQNIHQRVFPQDSELSNAPDYYDQIGEQVSDVPSLSADVPSLSADDVPSNISTSSNDQPCQLFTPSIETIAIPNPISHRGRTMAIPNPISHGGRIFGQARPDILEVKKRFEWLPQEKSFLQKYVQEIEPIINPQRENRYSKCLTYIKQTAPQEVIQYFHPHHLVNSDRLKNGFE